MLDISKYNRIFTFGCSYTLYQWPTWADILINDADIPGYNYALPGLGNVGIFHKIIEADIRHGFDRNDCILICWSSWMREDRYLNGEWKRFGNVYNNDFYNRHFWKYCSRSNDIVKNSTAIIAINKLYNDKIIFQGSMMEPADRFDFVKETEDCKNLEDFYYPAFFIPEENCWDNFIHDSYDEKDLHPTVSSHLQYLENIVGYKCKESTKEEYNRIHKKIQIAAKKYPKYYQSKIQETLYQTKVLGL